MSVDEQVVPFKGVHSIKCYLPKKPKKWSYKFWARAWTSGCTCDFEVHGGLGLKGDLHLQKHVERVILLSYD